MLLSASDFSVTSSDSIVHVMPSFLLWGYRRLRRVTRGLHSVTRGYRRWPYVQKMVLYLPLCGIVVLMMVCSATKRELVREHVNEAPDGACLAC